MHITINCRSILNKHYTGIGRYTYNLIQSLSEIDTRNQYSLYVRKGLFDRKKKVPRFDKPNFTIRVDRLKRGPQKTVKNADIYHCPHPDVFRVETARVIVTIHDLVYKAFPEGHTRKTLRLTNEQMLSLLPQASRVICVSENTRQDLLKYFQVSDDKVRVVHQGVDKEAFYPIAEGEEEAARKTLKRYDIPGPFLLFVGTVEPRKNLKLLLYAFQLLKKEGAYQGKLVVAGMVGWKSEDLRNHIETLGIEDDVVFTGFVTNDQLRHFYNKTDVFVFPSFYEGFGYPVVEAFCCGAPVAASRASSMPEVAGDAALLIDPNHAEDLMQKIKDILSDPALKESLRQKGLKRAEDFSFTKTARETLKVYEEVYRETL